MSATLVVWCPPDPHAGRHRLADGAERARAAAYRCSVDSDRHLTGRVLARRAAAAWLEVAASDFAVDLEPEGRPVLVDRAGHRLDAHISITHAGDLVGVAVSPDPVGLDVQDVAALDGLLASPDIWTRRELLDLAALPPVAGLRTAAQWWTAKEAVLKSQGRGLLVPVDELDVRGCDVPWTALDVGPGHAAAVAGRAVGTTTVVELAAVDAPLSRR